MEMSFAQALNEAKQVIVQQSNRIKADAEKIKQQQQTMVDQCSIITEHEMKRKEQAADLARKVEQLASLETRLAQMTVAREQAEAVIDRQGQRLTSLQEHVAAVQRLTAEQAEKIEQLAAERDELRNQLPSPEDQEALAAMAVLLTTKKAPAAQKDARSTGTMRMGGEPFAQAA